MLKLTKRQIKLLEIIGKLKIASNQSISEEMKEVSRITIIRDLNFLLKQDLIEKQGKGRSVTYEVKEEYINIDEYFQKEADQREVKFKRFNFDVLKKKDIFQKEELEELDTLTKDYQKRIKSLSKGIIKKEFERLTIELSWKSSKIEGNTYSLLDTEVLIKENKEAKGHNREEAVMILNHKKALDFISFKRNDFRVLTLTKVTSIHDLIIKDLGVKRGIREEPVGIVGTSYKPLDNEHQIREAIEKMIKNINSIKDPFSKAFFAIYALSYIQPFEDGNKRTARLLGNALLLAHNVCPLSFRSVDEVEYKKALIIFFEQNNIRAFKDIFREQFEFSVGNYFLN